VFWYLERPLRLVAAKDLRTFLRDPAQWSQLTILFGLLVLYLTNMPTLRLEFSASGWFLVIPFLNLCAVSLILATFTCRFVFPLISLEGQKLWLMGVLPMRRGRILRAKFAFSMTVTLLVAFGSMTLAAYMLHLDTVWTVIHLAVTFGVCFGLCGFSVGIGARVPLFGQTNVARIANGLGGTLNLLASVALVSVLLLGVGVATWRSRNLPTNSIPDVISLLSCGLSIATGIAAGLYALRMGARHFDRVEV
jgi:ABC-2 type transport system permease protein